MAKEVGGRPLITTGLVRYQASTRVKHDGKFVTEKTGYFGFSLLKYHSNSAPRSSTFL